MPRANTRSGDSSAFSSVVREEFIERLIGLLVPNVNEDIPQGELPPGVREPHRAEDLQHVVSESGDLEALASVSDHAGPDVGLEVSFKDGSCLDPESARNRVEEWLRVRNPALRWRSPNDVLASGDEAEREYLFGLIASIECGVHS